MVLTCRNIKSWSGFSETRVVFSVGSMPCTPAPTPRLRGPRVRALRLHGLCVCDTQSPLCSYPLFLCCGPGARPHLGRGSCRGFPQGLGVHHAACLITSVCLPVVGPDGDQHLDQRLGASTRQLPCPVDPGGTRIRAAWAHLLAGASPRVNFLLCFFLMTFFFPSSFLY